MPFFEDYSATAIFKRLRVSGLLMSGRQGKRDEVSVIGVKLVVMANAVHGKPTRRVMESASA